MAELVVIGILAVMLYAFVVVPLEGLAWMRGISRAKRRTVEAKREAEQRERLALQRRQAQSRQRHAAEIQRSKNRRDRNNTLGRNLQLALQQLPSDPDAKRIRSWTHAAESLPVDFRRRQFSRFRLLLLAQIDRWVASDIDLEVLQEDLRAITLSLGVAEFEADYLLRQVRESQQGPSVSDSSAFEQQLQRIHSEHQDRLAALNRIGDLDEEIRDELIEAEHQRYRSQLIRRPE